MNAETFVKDLAASNEKALGLFETGEKTSPKQESLAPLLKVALVNEISVAELAAFWMPSVADWELKITLARQAGDEARHFQLVQARLSELGMALDGFQPPPANPLFEYLRGLKSPVQRVAAGMFTLESIAFRVNDEFMRFAEAVGDAETARIYREYIQPDEKHHFELGGRLLSRYAADSDSQNQAREAAGKTLEIARSLRLSAKQRINASCLPGC